MLLTIHPKVLEYIGTGINDNGDTFILKEEQPKSKSSKVKVTKLRSSDQRVSELLLTIHHPKILEYIGTGINDNGDIFILTDLFDVDAGATVTLQSILKSLDLKTVIHVTRDCSARTTTMAIKSPTSMITISPASPIKCTSPFRSPCRINIKQINNNRSSSLAG